MEEETRALGEEDIYETIEAPKFVDFTAPDNFRPDDRYWFCLRVGCDQNHEEEMDTEAIYKNFVMRVMAARSPNVRFHKAPRNVKCPLTAPPKSSKPRASKLTLISSISKRIVDSKVKAKPFLARPRPNLTPTAKTKQSSAMAKALTTPRDRKCVSNHSKFLSVRNVKGHSVSAPKATKVVKSLVFNSPKKKAEIKSNELNTPVRTLCEIMKKLDITNGNKHTPIRSDALKKRLRGREVKSRVFDSLHSHKLQGKSKEKLLHHCSHIEPSKGMDVKDDSIDMDMDDHSRCGSNRHKEHQKILQIPELEPDKDMVSSSTSAESDVGRLFEVDEANNERIEAQEDINANSEIGKTQEIMENEDKENIAVPVHEENECGTAKSDDNRKSNTQGDNSERVAFGKHNNSKNMIKVKKVVKNPLKENSSANAGCGAQSLKNIKPKPTNPKPFRLRTDERGILREANMMEKKVHDPASTLKSLQGRKPQKKRENGIREKSQEAKIERVGIDSAKKVAKISSNLSAFTSQKQGLVASQLEQGKNMRTEKSKHNSEKLMRLQGKDVQKHGQMTKEASSSRLEINKKAAKTFEGSCSSKILSRGRTLTIPKEPNFHSIHIPKSCTKNE